MLELRAVTTAAIRMVERGESTVLATVMKVEGSAYRRVGARLLVANVGEQTGGSRESGLKGDLGANAWLRTENGPCVVSYDSTTDDETAWQLGLGCNGAVHVLLERLTTDGPDPLAFPRRCLLQDKRGVLATVFRADPETGFAIGERLAVTESGEAEGEFSHRSLTERVRLDAAECLYLDSSCVNTYALPTGEVEICLEVIRPPRRLVIFGAGSDVPPLVQAAKLLGWHVTLVDRRPTYANQDAFKVADEVIVAPARKACETLRFNNNTAAVVMNHNFSEDLLTVESLLQTSTRYIGVLGPRARAEKLLAEVDRHSSELSPGQFARLHAPIGLDIGAENPQEIAVAVVAQIVATFAERDGRDLRERAGSIRQRESAQVAEVLV
ncbi:MAG: XdhC family protein [Planctomycetes bacterium]|nr:XdhC family protein [Planctomycetota bacterium]